jgi:hypothetical protein
MRGPNRSRFVSGGEWERIGFGEPTALRPTCLCRHCVIAGEGAGFLTLKEADPLHQLPRVVLHVAEPRRDFPGFDRRWLWHLSIQLFVFGPKTSEASGVL